MKYEYISNFIRNEEFIMTEFLCNINIIAIF